jgi:acyl carrier protein
MGERSLRAVIREELEREAGLPAGLGDDVDLWAAGMTSIQCIRLMMSLEDRLVTAFPPAEVTAETFTSVSSIEQTLSRALATRSAERAR